MKKLVSAVLSTVIIFSCFIIPVSAADKSSKLPFELVPSKTVSLDRREEGGTTLQFSYSMENDMIKFLQDMQDDSKRAALLNELGADDIFINSQIDWAVDDPTDWHCNEYWDENEATLYFGLGHDSEGRSRVSDWDYVDVSIIDGIQSTHDCWIMRHAGNPADPTDSIWYGTTYEDGTRCVGIKDQLKEGQYSIVEDEPGYSHVEINYNAHTAYARMRYRVTLRIPEYNEAGDCVGMVDRYLFSEWSNTASYGKDGEKWKPYDAASIKPPVISDPYISEYDFNGYPVVGYTLDVSDELNKAVTEITARGGWISIETEARVKGTEEWKTLQGDFEIRGGKLESCILAINGDGKKVLKGTEIEFRACFRFDQRLTEQGELLGEIKTGYSNVLNYTIDKDYGDESQPDPTDSGEEPDDEPVVKEIDEGLSKTQIDSFITGLKSDDDPKGTTFGLLSARQKKVKSNSITICWNKVKGAKTYVIYGNKCGKKNAYKYMTTTTKTSYTQKKLKKGTYYKYLVTAFDKKGNSITSAKTLHIAAKGGKAGNFNKVTTAAKKDKLSLKNGKSFKLKAKAVPESKKLKVSVHRKIQYESSNPKVAAVSDNGTVTAKKKGVCYVYAYAQSGAFKKIKVTVK